MPEVRRGDQVCLFTPVASPLLVKARKRFPRRADVGEPGVAAEWEALRTPGPGLLLCCAGHTGWLAPDTYASDNGTH